MWKWAATRVDLEGLLVKGCVLWKQTMEVKTLRVDLH